jgi:hypothetical protein
VSQIVQKHLEAIGASMALLNAQLEALKHAVAPAPVPSARVAVPERCAGISAADCAEQDGEWYTGRRTLGNPTHEQCRGCGYERSAAPDN